MVKKENVENDILLAVKGRIVLHMYKYHTFTTRSPVDEYIRSFQDLAILSYAAINMPVHGYCNTFLTLWGEKRKERDGGRESERRERGSKQGGKGRGKTSLVETSIKMGLSQICLTTRFQVSCEPWRNHPWLEEDSVC